MNLLRVIKNFPYKSGLIKEEEELKVITGGNLEDRKREM